MLRTPICSNEGLYGKLMFRIYVCRDPYNVMENWNVLRDKLEIILGISKMANWNGHALLEHSLKEDICMNEMVKRRWRVVISQDYL